MNQRQNFRSGTRRSIANNDGRPQSNGDSERNMWSSMLDSVASGKKLPEKNLIVLGGSTETQKDFLETLGSENVPKRPQDRYRKKPPIANDYALGYTYQDVLDADHEDLLARLSVYLLSEPLPAFAPLVKPLLTARSIPETLIVILLDWIEPWHWVRQIRDWVRFLRGITEGLEEEAQDAMTVTTKEWQQRRRGGTTYDTGGTSSTSDSKVNIPLSQGEWDEPLGLPICVVCHGADKIDLLEKTHSWREEEFDFVLQYLRTILMKHGSSLIYTSHSVPNSLPTLIHSSLNISSLLKKQTLKHNVIDRDKILIPPNWDSWGKIRVLREGFDVEGISSGWSIEIQPPPPVPDPPSTESEGTPDEEQSNGPANPTGPAPSSILPLYASQIPNPHAHNLPPSAPTIETTALPTQTFLTTELSRLEVLKADDNASSNPPKPPSSTTSAPPTQDMDSQIGPVQVNVGGIQVDPDDMLQRLTSRSREKGGEGGRGGEKTPREKEAETPQKAKAENEALANFFAGLMKKERVGSPRGDRSGGGGSEGGK